MTLSTARDLRNRIDTNFTQAEVAEAAGDLMRATFLRVEAQELTDELIDGGFDPITPNT